MNSIRCIQFAIAAFAFANALSAQTITGTDPVKIFILAGESNMHGKGTVAPATTPGTLDHVYANDPTARYAFLKSGGSYVTRADVGIRGLVFSGAPNPGNLTINYGGGATGLIGPELGFGHVLGDAFDNKVLIVKVGVDGTTLGGSFCPPSSRIGEPEPLVAGDKGFYYKEIIRLVNEAKAQFPGNCEIVGLGWHQGWNDRSVAAFSAVYETNMANFITDIRNDLATPNLPVVIASAAMDWNYGYSEVEQAQLKMADATAYPAFAGNVAVVDTRQIYDGLEFWQPVHNSPANEGYHWNRSGKTFLHIGMAMGDAMTSMVSTRIPYRIRANGGLGGVTLTWKNGTEIPTSVRVLRNGVEIAAAAPANPATFVDTTAPLGVHNYELQFTMPVSPCPPLTIRQITDITNFKANQRVNGVRLTWDNNLGYSGITVKRNGTVIAASLPGTATSYTHLAPPTGAATYSVEPVDAGATPVEAQITVSAAPAGGALIYEPFEMTANTTLAGKDGGIGLDGKWDGDSGIQVIPGNDLNDAYTDYTFGTLPVFGNRIARVSGGNGSCTINIGNTLHDAGLMEHGSQLWFSFLSQNPDNININPTLMLGNDIATGWDKVAMEGSAIGARLQQGKNVQGIILNNGVLTGNTPNQVVLTTSEVVLVVGRITWGADATTPDTIEIYTPGTNLVLDSPQSFSAVVDQSNFKVLSMWGNGVTPNMDEIRFGASYDAVIGQAPDTSGDFTSPEPSTMSFATPPAAISQSAITMTATTATDVNGVQYQFIETSGNPGGASSNWQDSPTYTNTGLSPNTEYTYTVQARDKSVNNNTNTASSPASATTLPPDLTPPPTPGFDTAPTAVSSFEITMTATTVVDPEGGAVQYLFTEISGNPGGTSSGWQSSPTYSDSGLNANTQYTYTVKARDSATPPNESVASSPASATTPELPPSITYVRQNNNTLLNTTGAWNPAGTPGVADVAAWTAAIGTAGNRTTTLGGSVSWGQILMNATDPGGDITIGNTAGASLTLNGIDGIGIDLSAAVRSLTINNPITLGSSQIWSSNTNRTITVGNHAIGDGGNGYGITKAGPGTLTVQGPNTFTCPITVTGGTLSINSIANGGSPGPLGQSSSAASNILLGNGTTLTYTGGAASSDRSFTINGTAAAHSATINANATGALNLTSTAPIAYGTPDQTRTLILSGANNLANTHVLAAQITNNGTGAVTLSKTGTGSVWHVTNPNNNFTGGVTFNRGFLVFSSGALGTTGAISIGANALPPFGLRWATGNTDDISSRFNNPSASSGQVTLDTGANDVVFANEIGFRADSWLTKAGSGSLTLNTASAWGAGTNAATLINEGTLVANVMANGGTKSSVGNTSNTARALGLRGGTLKYIGSGATTDRNFHISGNNTIDASGSAALVFSQTAIISPTPAPRTFLVGSGSSIGNASVSSSDLVPGMAVSGPGIQAGSKIVSIGTNGAIILDKTPTYSGGTLTFGSYLAGTLTLTGTNTGSNEIRGILRDSVSDIDASTTTLAITKSGPGKWVLFGANTYTGPTLVNEGTLALVGGTQASPITVGSGGTLGFTLGAPPVSSSSVNLTTGSLAITGTTDGESEYLLMTATGGFTVNPALDPSIAGYQFQVRNSGTELWLAPAAATTPYEDWAGPGIAFTGDANNDGIANGLAWILGAATPTANALNKLPKATTPAGYLQLEFTRQNPHAPAKLFLEFGNNLVGWTKLEIPAASGNIGGNIEVTVTPGPPDTILIKIPTTHDADTGKLFTRLSVVEGSSP
jgi:autotransporter-associated beta strand protein